MTAEIPFNSIMEIVKRPEIIFTEGHGSWLIDHHGHRYLDFIQGWAVNCLGHCPEVVVKALQTQVAKLINPSPAYYNEHMIALANLLVENSCFDKVFFANSGAEANEGAVKLARKWGSLHKDGAYEIITLDHAFHGRTLAMMSASGKPQWAQLFEPKVSGFPKAILNDLESVKKLIKPETVGIMLEPIQGEAGVFPADPVFLRELRHLCDENKLLLIFDEVQTGIGRTGTLFAYEHFGLEPDIMTLGKGLGAGVPLAALLAKEQFSCFATGDQGGTFNGNPLVTAVGRAVVETMLKPGFFESVRERSSYLRRKLEILAAEFSCSEVRGLGFLLALGLNQPKGADIASAAFAQHLIINSPNPQSLRFMPSLLVTEQEIDLMIATLERVMRQIVGK